MVACATAPASAPVTSQPTAKAKRVESSADFGSRMPFVSPHSYANYVRAEVLALRGDWDASIAAFDQALAGAEVDAYLLSRYAFALDRGGHLDEAKQSLDEAVSLAPDDAAVHAELGDFYARHDNTAMALGEYERALSLSPHGLRAALSLAALLEEQGASDRAQATLQRFASRNHDFAVQSARASLALALEQEDGPRANEAIAQLRELSQLSPAEVARAARLWMKQGEPLRAAMLLGPMPPEPSLLPLRLRAYMGAGWMAKARDLLVNWGEEQLGGFPLVTQALLDVGLPERALDSAAAAKVLHRNEPAQAHMAALLEAQAHLKLNQPNLAMDSLEQISQDDPLAKQAQTLRLAAIAQAGLPALADVVGERLGASPTSEVAK